VDTYKTELIADRVWRTRAQLEIATIEWVGWYNHERLHESLGVDLGADSPLNAVNAPAARSQPNAPSAPPREHC
jgi:transposase InsO family protein